MDMGFPLVLSRIVQARSALHKWPQGARRRRYDGPVNQRTPHVLGIDDGPFDKGQRDPVPIVGVTMAGAGLVESVAVTSFVVDGANVTGFLADWITSLRIQPSVRGIVVGGITIAGLGILDINDLAARCGCPVLAVTRSAPTDDALLAALAAAGLEDRAPIVRASPRATNIEDGLHVACAGIDEDGAATLVRSTLGRARLPEPLRIAHLIARAIVTGESRGRA
jgi:endonuclease V-like protein UPF0215 family